MQDRDFELRVLSSVTVLVNVTVSGSVRGIRLVVSWSGVEGMRSRNSLEPTGELRSTLFLGSSKVSLSFLLPLELMATDVLAD